MRLKISHLVACSAVMAVCVTTFADTWPTFRGAERTAIAPDTDLLESWPEDGPKLVWETAGAGRGYASMAITEDKMFTLGDGPSTGDDADEYLICFDRKTGKQLWKTKTGEPWNNGKDDWQGSRSTPTVDGDHVYVITPFGRLVCATTAGEIVWSKQLKEDFNGKKADSWGYSESPLIDGDKVVCTPGGAVNTMVALDKKTGDAIWRCSRKVDRGAGHASIVISEIDGTRVYVNTTGQGALGVRADDGKLLWSYEIDKTTAVIPSPIIRDDLVFFSAGYKRGGALLKQVKTDDGVKVEEIYPLNTKLANKHGGIVLIGDYLYGDTDSSGIPFCAELMTGDVKWKGRGSGRSSACIAAADGHLYIRYTNGVMSLVKADPAEFTEVSHFQVPGSEDLPSWAHPVIVDGHLYLREGDKVYCYSLKG